MSDETFEVQRQLQELLGEPKQVLGARSGAFTLQYDQTAISLNDLFARMEAKVLSIGLTPIRVGGAAIVPRAVARKGGVHILGRGRVERDSLVGTDFVITEPLAIGSSNAPAVLEFMIDTLEAMADPEDGFVGLVNHVLDMKFAEGPEHGKRLLGRMLTALGHHLTDSTK